MTDTTSKKYTPEQVEAIERLREIAYRDEAKAVTVRASDLRVAVAALRKQEVRGVSEAMLKVAQDAWNRHQANCRITTVEGSLQKVVEAIAALYAPEPAAQGDAVAWMVPSIVSFKDAVRTSCPPDIQAQIEGTVAWHPEIMGDSPPVTDRNGVTHKPRPLVYGDTAPPAQPAERVPDGWKLAMWVLQSDLYRKLPEEERAVCDALVAENPYIAATSAPSESEGGKGVEAALPPAGWRACSKCKRYGRSDDCTRCGGSGWRRKCDNLDCIEYGCCAGQHCYIPRAEVEAELTRQLADQQAAR